MIWHIVSNQKRQLLELFLLLLLYLTHSQYSIHHDDDHDGVN